MQAEPKRVLPPGVDPTQITFGTMWLRIGKLKVNRNKSATNNIFVQFWGQESPVVLLTKSNPLNKTEEKTLIQYDVKCPTTIFKEYLIDMKKNLRLEVQDVGKVDFDLTKFLIENLQVTSKHVFNHFKECFQILGKHSRKIGSIQIQMSTEFDPEVAKRQLGSIIQPSEEESKPCVFDTPADILQTSLKKQSQLDDPMNGQSSKKQCSSNKLQPFITSSGKKQPIHIHQQYDDNRIPNSLNTQMPEEQFDPIKYKHDDDNLQSVHQSISRKGSPLKSDFVKQLDIKEKEEKEKEKDKKEEQQQKHSQKKSIEQVNKNVFENKVQSLNQQQCASDRKGSQQAESSKFPNIKKVLTYSQLKQLKSQKAQSQQKQRRGRSQDFQDQSQATPKNILRPMQSLASPPSNNNNKANRFGIQQRQEQLVSFSKKTVMEKTPKPQSDYDYRAKALEQSPQHSQQFRKSPIKEIDEISQINPKQIDKHDQQNDKDDESQESKQVLSRVVNLDQELRKSEVNSPMKKPKMKRDFSIEEKPQHHEHKQHSLIEKNSQTNTAALNFNNRTQQNFAGQNLKPITHYNTGIQQPQRFVPPGRYNRQGKPSSLIVNLIVEIDTKSVKLSRKQKFVLVHRPYGSKQRVKLGPKFSNQKITIMCPVGQELIKKMDKMPFIIQIWGSVSNQFIGIIKLDLHKIKQGFILQDRLNEIAIKTSFMPIIIHKGQRDILNLQGQKSGQCMMYAGIGTSAQIDSYLNSNTTSLPKPVGKNQKWQKEQTQESQPQQADHEIKKHTCVQITQMMNHIDQNSMKNIIFLANLIKKTQISDLQFNEFLQSIQYNHKYEAQLLRNMFHAYQRKSSGKPQKFIQTKNIKDSFDQYKQAQSQVIKNFKQINSYMKKQLNSQTIETLSKQVHLNILSIQQFKQISTKMQEQISKSIIDYYCSFFGEYMDFRVLTNVQESESYVPETLVLAKYVWEVIYWALYSTGSNIQYLLSTIKEDLSSSSNQGDVVMSLITFFNKFEHTKQWVSTWSIACLCQTALGQKIDTKQIQFQSLSQFLINFQSQVQKKYTISQMLQSLNQIQKQKQRLKFNSQKSITKQQQQQQSKKINENKEIHSNDDNSLNHSTNINNLLNKNNKQLSQMNSKETNNDKNQNQNQKQKDNIQDNRDHDHHRQSSLPQPSDLSVDNGITAGNTYFPQQENNQTQNEKHFQYTFKLKGLQLFLQYPFDGECQLEYYFPYEQEPVHSKRIKTFKNKHRYLINFYGQHSLIMDGNIQAYLNQIPVKFTLRVKDTILLEGDLHPDELLSVEQDTELKVVPLFNQDIEKIQGKIKLEIGYNCEQTQKDTLGRETVYNLFLPKSGFINFDFLIKVEEHKIRQQYRLEDVEYYIVIVLDLFNEDQNLKKHYLPKSSRLYSTPDFSDQIEFRNSCKVSLNTVILEYFKERNCLLSMNIIYYIKQRGNYEKKQVNFASLKIPLINLIKDEGIKGNYAFKNRYGIFAGLCKAQMKYEKNQKKQQICSKTNLGMTSISRVQNKTKTIWMIVHFTEMLNFSYGLDPTIVRFQTILKGQKYQTNKIHLPDCPILMLGDYIMLSLTQQQFNSIKILPISVIFDKGIKYAIDINMKPISKQINSQNLYAFGGYFMTVNQHSEMTKLKIGARVIVFKGPRSIQPFVQAFCNNIDSDVFAQIDLPRDIENYSKLIELFRTNLAISKRIFEDSVHHLLHRRQDKLPIQLMTPQLLYKLNLSPIVSESEQDVNSLARQLSQTVSCKAFIQFIKENSYKLTNLREQILQRYSFSNLWIDRLDKNVEYFSLERQIDVLTLIRKIKVVRSVQNDQEPTALAAQSSFKALRVSIDKGVNFHYLYNGIKPNVLLRFPQFGYQSKIKSRSSDPIFNESFRQIIQPEKQYNSLIFSEHLFRKLIVQAYHISSSTRSSEEEILIGQGWINLHSSINFSSNKPESKRVKVVLSSVMSSKMKAILQLQIGISCLQEEEYISTLQEKRHMFEQQMQDASRIQDIIKDINHDMEDKQYLFENSSEDQQY